MQIKLKVVAKLYIKKKRFFFKSFKKSIFIFDGFRWRYLLKKKDQKKIQNLNGDVIMDLLCNNK